MQPRLTTKAVDEVLCAIQTLNLESVKLRVMDPELGEGWTRDYAESIEAAYKRYLVMQVKYPDDAENILLSKDVDEFWHTHILQTAKYADDCQNMFGNFLHHNPHVGKLSPAMQEKRAKAAEKTRQLYEWEFGGGQSADAAWSGAVISVTNAAMSNSEIRAGNAAMSNSEIRASNAAMSNSEIQAGNAAMSNSEIRAGNAAMSNSEIRAGNAAMSNSEIRAGNAAMSNSEIRAGNAAMSNSEIRAGAMFNITIPAHGVRMSDGAIRI
jgi:hypothetical protein